MKILVACEFSGIVREAFIKAGHEATSCDLLPSDKLGPHHQGDVKDVINNGWDMLLAFPPCTYLANSGARWFQFRQLEQLLALQFVQMLMDASIEKIALENPIGVISTAIRRPDQIIQPWQFGHGETKATCLWLKNLPILSPTDVVEGREARIHKMAPSKDRGKMRSLTYQGIADAMAEQWG